MTIRLPLPPSVNALYANRNDSGSKFGRYKTKRYKQWLTACDREGLLQRFGSKQLRGNLAIAIRAPKSRADASNFIKAIEDYLVSREITGDDRHNHKVSIEVDGALPPGYCEVTITQLGA